VIPRLETQRLVLRAPRLADFEPYAAFFASERARWEDGPLSRSEAWREFATATGCWTLRGFGAFSVEEKATGRYLGEVGLYQPDHFPEPEIGWILVEEAEGRGIAYEAAVAVRDWAYQSLGLRTLVCYIAPGNLRSIRLAERLGARRDPEASDCDATSQVWRHRQLETVR